jgi:hypothetical protein
LRTQSASSKAAIPELACLKSIILPLILVGLLSFWEWLATGHWVRATLCTASYALGGPMDGPSWESYEFIRCPVNTGLQVLDFILNYFINELSVFASVSTISAIGLVLTTHLWARCVLSETEEWNL